VAQAVKPAEPRFISAFLAALDQRRVFRVGHQTGFHGIILNVRPDAVRFPIRLAHGENLPKKRRKAEMNLGSAGLTAWLDSLRHEL
jgi:hypothetical protein